MEKLSLDKFTDNKLENMKVVKGGCRKTTYYYKAGHEYRDDTLTCDGIFVAL